MTAIHGHAQIEYTGEDGLQVESIYPIRNSFECREFLHAMLDEYLDYLSKRLDNKERGEKHPNNRFIIFDMIDGE